MEFGSKGSILNWQVYYIEKSKLKIADMWLIPLDRVTYCVSFHYHFVLHVLLFSQKKGSVAETFGEKKKSQALCNF